MAPLESTPFSTPGTITSRGLQRTRPLSAGHLRALEAVARHLNFRAAAEELSLTQSAVSRQIQALEDEIGVSVFLRHTRAVELTSAGAQLLRAVVPSLERIDATVRLIRRTAGRKSVAITTWASFASLWLIPRLEAFQSEYPDIDIRIDATDNSVDLETSDLDLALRYKRPAQHIPLDNGAHRRNGGCRNHAVHRFRSGFQVTLKPEPSGRRSACRNTPQALPPLNMPATNLLVSASVPRKGTKYPGRQARLRVGGNTHCTAFAHFLNHAEDAFLGRWRNTVTQLHTLLAQQLINSLQLWRTVEDDRFALRAVGPEPQAQRRRLRFSPGFPDPPSARRQGSAQARACHP